MKKILLIEDEVSIAELQRDYLEINDFEIDVQYSGDKGLEKALNEHFDLVILDIMLPKVSGFDYITKPFSPGERVARVKAHLARYERLSDKQEKRMIRIHGLAIDTLARRVFVNDKEVFFTAKEFDLLKFIVSHPNQVLSKEHLFEKIWGFDSSGDISTVTVHIRKLREKLEENPADPQYLETVWGAGYRFNI